MKVPQIKITKKLILILSSIAVIIVLAILIPPQITKIYDKYGIRQPQWEVFDKQNTEPQFALTKLTQEMVPTGEKEGTNYFFRNRIPAYGTTSSEECYKTEYKCGDNGWKDFKYSSVILDNKCIVKVKPGTYCNVILPGGTLIAATNERNKTDLVNSIFHFYENDLIFQIISTEEQITIKQSITKQESSLWHSLSPNFDKKYIVEVGDQKVEATGTEFYTSTDENLGSVTTVIHGSVKVADTKIKKGQFAQIPYFNVTSCPPILKACGNSCIPANGVCCDTNSYCLSPVQCQENTAGKCEANLFSGNSSQFCCYNNPNASSFSLFEKGSYDCKDGYKFCANRCIPEDQECCYPTDNDCPVAVDDLDIGTGDVPSGHEFPRAYFFNLYDKLLENAKYIELVSKKAFESSTFNFDEVLKYISEYLAPTIDKDYANSNQQEEMTTYCTNYPNSGACPSANESDDDTSASGDCSMVNDIDITFCYVEGVGLMVKNKPGYVQCTFKYDKNDTKYCKSSGNMVCTGVSEGAIPKKCLPKGFNSWSTH
jgi:hypothetical protein